MWTNNRISRGASTAFEPSLVFLNTLPTPTLEDIYISGLSLTHGERGVRRHMWSFAGAFSEHQTCPCKRSSSSRPFEIPDFVGQDYFCESGCKFAIHTIDIVNDFYATLQTTVFTEDPLWDGEGCYGSNSSCCQFNQPPWFCKTLSYHTTEDRELRLCNPDLVRGGDRLVSLVS